jgi:hypothetical protein
MSEHFYIDGIYELQGGVSCEARPVEASAEDIEIAEAGSDQQTALIRASIGTYMCLCVLLDRWATRL